MWEGLITGQVAQLLNPKLPVRSNIFELGATLADTSVAATGVGAVVPVRVVPGDKISQVRVPIGATAAGTPTHSGVGIYSGTPVAANATLLAKSKDGLTAAIPAEKMFTFTLEEPLEITQAMAPNGYVYVLVTVTATTTPTVQNVAIATTVHYPPFPNAPVFLGATAGSALNGVPPATLTGAAVSGKAPIVYLI